ncbi:MAG: peroxidase-related enzyme [Chthoniobacterales bacterium]
MSWIETISYQESSGRLRALYDRLKAPNVPVDQILQAHSLRPHTLEGHMGLYKNVLHHSGNRLPKWILETIGVYVSLLNGCGYCVEHHFAGLQKLLGNAERAAELRRILEGAAPDKIANFDPRLDEILAYARRLTETPAAIDEAAIERLRAAGLDDGEILEVNQVASYFAYANRTVLGLGVTTKGDVLGLSPNDSDDPENWRHA